MRSIEAAPLACMRSSTSVASSTSKGVPGPVSIVRSRYRYFAICQRRASISVVSTSISDSTPRNPQKYTRVALSVCFGPGVTARSGPTF